MGLDFPLLGAGAGTFVSVYPSYRTIPTPALVTSPHNEYVHVLAETGVAGCAILALAMALVCVAIVRGLAARKDPFVRGFLAGAVGAPLMVSLHSVVDFPMRAPAVAATLAVVLALLERCAVVRDRRRHASGARADALPAQEGGGSGDAVPVRAGAPDGGGVRGKDGGARRHANEVFKDAVSLRWGLLAVAPVALVWALMCNFALNPLRGQLEARSIARARASAAADNAVAFVEAAEEAIATHSRDNAGLRGQLASFARKASCSARDPLARVVLADKAVELGRAAALFEPLNADHALALAEGYLSLQRPDLALLQAERACELLPQDPWVRLYLADVFIAAGWVRLAARYLDQAERIAAAGEIDAVQPLIDRVRERFQRASAAL